MNGNHCSGLPVHICVPTESSDTSRSASPGAGRSPRPRLRAALTIFALSICAAALTAAPASAAIEATKTYAPGAFFGGQGTEPGQFNAPRQIAAEPGTGNLLVADTGNGRVQVFSTDAAGNPTFLTTLGTGTLTTPAGIAVDPGTGAIYVSDSGAGKILRFTSDGAPTPTYTLDPTFTSPTELASFASPLAVDPTTHDLLVADTGSQEIRRFDVGDGHLIKAFNGSTSPGGPFTSLRSLAVAASGTIYVVDEAYPEAVYVEPGAGRTERFDAAGESLGQLQGGAQPGAVGADPTTGAVALIADNLFFAPPRRLALYEGSDTPASSYKFPASVEGGALAVATTAAAQPSFYVLTEPAAGFGSPGIQPLSPAEIPAAAVGPTGGVTPATAHLTGAVAPGTLSGTGTAHFEYSLDATTWTSTPDQPGIAGPGETAISADITGLRPNTAYLVRVHIANDDFATDSPLAVFSTEAVAPQVQASPLTDRTATSAVLNAKVNPFGQQTTYHFEYGLTNAYGSSAPAAAEDVAGNGFAFRAASHQISGLQPSTTYHYRLVAHNATGTNATADATFTTRAATEPTRAYEQVTPVDKGGAVINTVAYHESRADGNAFLYQTRNAMDLPDTGGAPLETRYAARRSHSGWDRRTLDAPQDPIRVPFLLSASTVAISDDFSHALVVSNRALAPGAVDGVGNYYRRDVETGSLELIATGLNYFSISGATGSSRFYAASPDFSTIFFDSDAQLTDDAPFGVTKLYEWRVGEGLRLASRMPDGAPSDGIVGIFFDRLESPNDLDLATADGSQVYFATWGGTADGIYRVADGVTTRILATPEAASVFDVSADGRYVAYRMGVNLYRYDTSDGSSELIFENFGNEYQAGGYLGMSEDGSSFMLGRTGSGKIEAWRDGVVSPIATTSFGVDTGYIRNVFSSPNGRYFVFSTAALEGQSYDNTGCAFDALDSYAEGGRCVEIYVYDTVEKTMSCASCPADGSRSTGHAHNSFTQIELGGYAGRRVSNSGEVLFDTPTKLVAADTNGVRDVYLYQDGEARLISPGNGPHEAYLADASASFDDIFIITDQSLVGQDRDDAYDVYDARVGGGIPSQSEGGKTVSPCAGADCRGPVAPASLPPSAASESVSGSPGTGRHAKRKHHHKKKKRVVKRRRSARNHQAPPPAQRLRPATSAAERGHGK